MWCPQPLRRRQLAFNQAQCPCLRFQCLLLWLRPSLNRAVQLLLMLLCHPRCTPGNLNMLQRLALDGAGLAGPVPAELSNLAGLSYLSLQGNAFSE